MKSATVLAAAAFAVFHAVPADAASYYLFDGDSSRAVEIAGGTVVNAFDTFSLGYPVAITDTIWLGHRDNEGATQFALDGTPTGATSPGGAFISQLLDGTTNGANNFGVSCCHSQIVTIADADWSNQTELFGISDDASGIAYSTLGNSLFVSDFNGKVTNYALDGTVLGQFDSGKTLVGLAYDQSSDSLWGWNRRASALEQYSTSGTLLQSQTINVVAHGISNPYGGEMAIRPVAGAVPEPATWAMMLLGFGFVGGAMRGAKRRRLGIFGHA